MESQILRVLQPLADLPDRTHGRSPEIKRMEMCKCEPCLVPMENDIRLYRQDFHHEIFAVMNQTVKSGVCQRYLLQPVELVVLFQFEHDRFYLRDIDASIQVVLFKRVGIQKNGQRSGQHH